MRHPGLERREKRDAHIGVADSSERTPETLEAVAKILDVLTAFRVAEQRKKLSDPARRYAGVVDTGDGTVEHTGKILSQRVYLCTEQAMGRNEFKHKRPG